MFQRILAGCVLMWCGSTALAFTLIPPPQEQETPSSSITEATTLLTQIQPIAAAIRAQLLSQRRPDGSRRTAQLGPVLAANAHADRASDFVYLAAAGAPGAGGMGGNSESLWISAATNSLKNEFVRTSFYGATHNVLAGFDLTRSGRYVFGVAIGHEASNFTTEFNVGNEKTRGYNVSPYFGYLLSDSWGLDLSLGYGDFDTRQSRTLGSTTVLLGTDSVRSEFSSTREFASANLTNVSALGNWVLTGSAGVLTTKRKNDAYVESNGTAVGGSSQSIDQWNLLGEVAYGRGASEAYVGFVYEKTRNPVKIQFATGAQPANDDDSVLVTAGWRHFGKGLTTNFVLSSREAQDQVREYGFSMMIRVDL